MIRKAKDKKVWQIELVDPETGNPLGMFTSSMKSQQMRFPKNGTDEWEFPADNNNDGLDMVMHIEPEPQSSEEENEFAWEPQIEVQVGKNGAVTVDVSSTSDGTKAAPPDNIDQDLPPLQPHDVSIYDSDDEEEDPDNILEEDVPRKQGDEEGECGKYSVEELFQSQDFADFHGIEKDDTKYEWKKQQYLREKESLISSRWSAKVKPPSNKGIDLGSKVQEHGKDSLQQVGTVLGDN
jgi:hypothetical protein